MIMQHFGGFSKRLRIKLQISLGPLMEYEHKPENLDGIETDPTFAKRFINYIFILHTLMRASVPLMQAAYERCLEIEKDELISSLIIYYKRHINEELNHDEWLLDDLEAVGIMRREILSRKPSLAVAELVGSQYYWIYHWDPIYLLGYIAVLEGFPPKKEELDRLQQRTGFSEKAFRTLAKHSYLDPHHKDDLDTLLNNLPLRPHHEEWITSNALQTAHRLIEIVRY
jgi:hypothetical protein